MSELDLVLQRNTFKFLKHFQAHKTENINKGNNRVEQNYLSR